ncbi:phage holin family protein [Paenibacillus sp. MWE-103]|uniref:Phage holin family protein n=1 Tax=Paenibacillus artemisiicola TaxID=1172618 RepID=A0ABS3W6M7_9BACL|nr:MULTISPECIES: phage holin family protein [Paenibacillus]MBO7743933.1 phage holin family protein [Paenibacillus artemisiicola]SFI59101.1 Phage holin family Hol44, holin superfamily V [Paenibacillus sp. UNC496MF]
MDFTVIQELIDPSLYILLAACWVLGYALKRTPHVPDWSIVYMLTVFAVVVSLFMLGFNVKSVLQGILTGAFSVYGHQLFKQARKGASGDDAGQTKQ